MNTLGFGSIFFYDNSEYVLLAIDGEDLYALKILDIETSNDVKTAFRVIMSKNNEIKQRLLIYKFVELVTPYYTHRIVTLVKTDGHDLSRASNSINRRLNSTDCENIKNEIMISNGVPLRLKELI